MNGLPPGLLVILCTLNRLPQGNVSTCNYPLDHLRVNTKCRRTLRGIQHPKPPTGPCTDIKKPSTAVKRLHSGLYRLLNPIPYLINRLHRLLVLVVHDLDDLGDGLGVQVLGGWVYAFCKWNCFLHCLSPATKMNYRKTEKSLFKRPPTSSPPLNLRGGWGELSFSLGPL